MQTLLELNSNDASKDHSRKKVDNENFTNGNINVSELIIHDWDGKGKTKLYKLHKALWTEPKSKDTIVTSATTSSSFTLFTILIG